MSVSEEQEVYPEEDSDIGNEEDAIFEEEPKTEEPKPEPVKPPVNFKYNKKSQEAYTNLGLKIPDTVDREERRFLEDVDLRYGAITRRVVQVHRIRPDDPRDGNRKEWLYYVEEWQAYDYLGNELAPVTSHIEGRYDEIIPRYTVDKKTGKPVKSDPKVGRKQTTFYIPWSKANLDKVLRMNKTTNKDTIMYYVHFGYRYSINGDERRDNTFTYDQIANSMWSDILALEAIPGGPRNAGIPQVPTKNKK